MHAFCLRSNAHGEQRDLPACCGHGGTHLRRLAAHVRHRAADNFRNLFELPVLFYLAIVVAAQTGLVTIPVVVLAWLFVVLRVAHSWIQCTYNKVMHRFYVYCAGGTVLWVLWAVLGYGLLRA
jgi:hypothetical protein